MLTLLGYGLLAILLAGVLFLLASYFLPAGEQIAPSIRDEPLWDLPAERALDATDVATVRLPVALRGYRFAETDLLLDRLADELKARDEELARLRGATRPQPSAPAATGAASPWAGPEEPDAAVDAPDAAEPTDAEPTDASDDER